MDEKFTLKFFLVFYVYSGIDNKWILIVFPHWGYNLKIGEGGGIKWE